MALNPLEARARARAHMYPYSYAPSWSRYFSTYTRVCTFKTRFLLLSAFFTNQPLMLVCSE